MKKTLKLLKKAKNIALISHVSPDPDTIGSTIALAGVLKKLGKNVDLFCSDDVPESYNFLTGSSEFNKQKQNGVLGYDLLVAVDIASLERVGCFADEFSKHPNTLRIDHHVSGISFAKHEYVTSASSTAVIVFEIASKLKAEVDSDSATALYLGICGDTGIFKNNNTDSVTFNVCAKLLQAGAKFRTVYTEFFEKKTVPYIKLTSNALLNADVNDKFGYVVMAVSKDDYNNFGASTDENVGNLPHSYLNCGYKIAVILKEKEDGIHCSLRSKFEYDVTKIAENFDGGGHKNAAGCKFDDSMTVAKKKISKAIENYLSSLNKGE